VISFFNRDRIIVGYVLGEYPHTWIPIIRLGEGYFR
jgi:hypothetical protein